MNQSEQNYWLQRQGRTDTGLPPLHFAHGNGFPTGTYREFLNGLRADYQIHAPEMLGHSAGFPVTDSWPHLVRELTASIESIGTSPVVLLGHSLGGMLSLMVARNRPDLVQCVLMLDSPVVSGWRAKILHGAKISGLAKLVGPGRFSKKRRKSWAEPEEAFQHFVKKPAFAVWPEPVLRDYIRYGTEPYERGVTLRFNREVETSIYNTLPHNIRRYTRPPFPVPIGFLCGTRSAECQQAGLTHTRELVGENFEWIEGTHLYPMESPQLTAQKTLAMLKTLRGIA